MRSLAAGNEANDLRIAVITPFVDRRHGTERVLAEQLQRLSRCDGIRIELYAQRVEGLELALNRHADQALSGLIFWHKVPSLPGPHLLQYLWWFLANSLKRAWHCLLGNLRADVTLSPGINAFGADVITVHIVFHAFHDQTVHELKLSNAPIRSWPRRLHRRLYYRCIMALENQIYRDSRVRLLPVSQLVARQLRDYFGRLDTEVVPNGVSVEQFHPAARMARRQSSREELHLSPGDFVLLLIGNDWVKKGLRCLLRAISSCEVPDLRLLVVGSDDPSLFAKEMADPFLQGAIRFLPPRDDVLFYYAAADAYAGPSLEDAFGLPILEAMACGLPVIASVFAGASEAVQEGQTGFLLHDPEDSRELAAKIKLLAEDESLRTDLGTAAAELARNYSWERNARLLYDVLADAARKKQARG